MNTRRPVSELHDALEQFGRRARKLSVARLEEFDVVLKAFIDLHDRWQWEAADRSRSRPSRPQCPVAAQQPTADRRSPIFQPARNCIHNRIVVEHPPRGFAKPPGGMSSMLPACGFGSG